MSFISRLVNYEATGLSFFFPVSLSKLVPGNISAEKSRILHLPFLKRCMRTAGRGLLFEFRSSLSERQQMHAGREITELADSIIPTSNVHPSNEATRAEHEMETGLPIHTEYMNRYLFINSLL